MNSLNWYNEIKANVTKTLSNKNATLAIVRNDPQHAGKNVTAVKADLEKDWNNKTYLKTVVTDYMVDLYEEEKHQEHWALFDFKGLELFIFDLFKLLCYTAYFGYQ